MARRKARAAPARRGHSPTSAFERSTLREAIVAVAAAKIALVIVVFDPGSLGAFDLPKSLVSRALAWVLAALVAVAVVRHGTAVVPRTRLHVVVVAYVAVVAASVGVAENTYMALYGDWGRFLGLTFAVDMAVLYLALAVAFRTDLDRAILFGAVALGSAVAIAYAALQALGADPVRWSIDPRIRPFGTVGAPDQLGHLLAVVASTSAAVAVLARAPRERAIASALAAAAVVAAGIVATRAVVAGIGAGAIAVALAWLASGRASRGVLTRSAGVAAAAVLLAAAVVALTPLGTRLGQTLQGAYVADRFLIWDMAARMAADRPVLGWGADNFGAVSLRYRLAATEATLGSARQNSAHDWVLQTAATTGALGLAATLALIVATAASLWRRHSARPELAGPALVALAAYWAQALFTVGSIAVDWVPWVCAGIAASLSAAPAPELARAPAALQRRDARVLEAAIATFVLLGMLSGLGAYRAATDAKSAQGRVDARDAGGAVTLALSATRADAGRSEHWVVLGRAHSAAGHEREAADAYAQATKRDPWSSDDWQHLGASLTRLALAGDTSHGGAAAAMAAARKAVDVDPNTSVPHFHVATVAFNLGDMRTALRECVRAIELYDRDGEYDRVAALAAAKLGDSEARDLIRQALRAKDSEALRNALADLDRRLGGS